MQTSIRKYGVIALFVALSACANMRRATRQDLDTVGTRDYRADREKVVKSLKAALTTIGYQITFEDPENGVIKTGKRVDHTSVSGNAYSASATQLSNALTIHLETRDGVQHIVAMPRAFQNMKEYPLEELNVGYARTIWTQLFHELDDNLGAPGVSPGEQAVEQASAQ